jgi:hypothetical protein
MGCEGGSHGACLPRVYEQREEVGMEEGGADGGWQRVGDEMLEGVRVGRSERCRSPPPATCHIQREGGQRGAEREARHLPRVTSRGRGVRGGATP